MLRLLPALALAIEFLFVGLEAAAGRLTGKDASLIALSSVLFSRP